MIKTIQSQTNIKNTAAKTASASEVND